jgi:hypothetical protein
MLRFVPSQSTGHWLAHIALAISFFALAHTASNYYLFVKVIEPSVEALAPVTADKTAEAISLQLPQSARGDSARALAQGQASEMRLLQDAWLTQTRAQGSGLQFQLLAWALVWITSLGLVIVQNRSRARAAPENGP